jgi:Nucleotidyltransferase domain.
MTEVTMSDGSNGVFLSLPLPDQQVFRYQAADDILELLYSNPHRKFTVTQLRQTTGHGGKSVDNAIKILRSLDLAEKESAGRESLIRINQDVVRKPEDPLLEIPQEQFRKPVKAFLDGVDTVDFPIKGVILFGSVARGEADRTSDIDLQVIVDENRPEIRRKLHDIKGEVEAETFDGDRYEFELLVESTTSMENYGSKLQTIFSEGIKLRESDRLREIEEVVFNGQ